MTRQPPESREVSLGPGIPRVTLEPLDLPATNHTEHQPQEEAMISSTTTTPDPMTRTQVLEIVAKAHETGQYAYLQDANLRDANLQYAYLQDANLRDANLQYANLQGADLRDANLQGADLRSAYLQDANLRDAAVGGGATDGVKLGPAPDPSLPLAVARMVLADPDKALRMEDWHTCETAHCLAGWAIHLSGPAGYLLEAATSPSVAGLLLAPSLAPHFYDDNEAALAVCRDIVAKAEAGAA